MASRLLSALRQRRQSWIRFTLWRKPHSQREWLGRSLIAVIVAAAIAGPFFIGRGGDAAAGAGEAFTAKLAELETLRAQRDSSGSSADLDTRITQLQSETRLGYLEREGDAAARGALAPDFRLLDLAGAPRQLSEIEGPVVLNFWASWCEPCIEEMPDFEAVSQELASRVSFIGVNDGESPETARTFAADVTGVSYLILLDPTKLLTNGPYLLIGRPTTFFIDAEGIIRNVRVGIVDIDTLRELVGDLIGAEISAESDPVAPLEYGRAALNAIDSARANFSVADTLLDRWREAPMVLSDAGWRRNIEAQTRIWSDLAAQFAELSPPQLWLELHQQVADSLAQIADAAGPLVRDAAASQSQGGLRVAVILFDSFRELFDSAADILAGVIHTMQ